MREIDDYGGVIKAIEDGWLQARLAQRALERKIAIDARETLVVGVNVHTGGSGGEMGEQFRIDPETTRTVKAKYAAIRESRNDDDVERTLAALSKAAASARENLLPHLADRSEERRVGKEGVRTFRSWWSPSH